jgi:hypothetical protein
MDTKRQEILLSGLSEILLILLIVVVLFFLPRIVSRSAPAGRKAPPRPLVKRLSGRLRLAILVSVVWLAAIVLWLRPWTGHQTLFVGIGAAPVIVGWGAYWVLAGFRQYRR